MASCLLGSTLFSKAITTVRAPTIAFSVTGLAAAAMAAAAYCSSLSSPPLLALVGSLFLFEATVGVYFPTIGTLRSKYLPDSHRSVIHNIFGIPLNLLVVGVFLNISKLGTTGALGISSAALGLAAAAALALDRLCKNDE